MLQIRFLSELPAHGKRIDVEVRVHNLESSYLVQQFVPLRGPRHAKFEPKRD